MELIKRTFQATATINGQGLKGVAVPFGVLSIKLSENRQSFKEKIAPGAADSSLAKNDIVALVAHDWKRPVARTTSKGLTLSATPTGLAFEVKTLPDTPWCRDLRIQVGAGLVVSCSFGFRYVQERLEKVGGELIRTVYEMDLREISFLVSPAYPNGTSIELSQTLGMAHLSRSRSMHAYLKAKRPVGNRLVAAR